MPSPYDIGLDKTPANFQPLTPLTFLERAAAVFPDHPAVIHGRQRATYAEFYARARRLAAALARRGIGRGDTVSVMLANTPAMLEAHYGVPMTGGVLNTLNTRLDAPIIAFSLDHAETKVLITDREFSKTVKTALTLAKTKPLRSTTTILVHGCRRTDRQHDGRRSRRRRRKFGLAHAGRRMGRDLLTTPGHHRRSQGRGYHHRGAYSLALGNVVTCGMAKIRSTCGLAHVPLQRQLPVVDLAVAGTHVCLRWRAPPPWRRHRQSPRHPSVRAPIVMTLLGAPDNERSRRMVEFFTARHCRPKPCWPP